MDLDASDQEEPDMMEGVPHEDALEETSLDDLKQQLAEAIATENYELASELKKKIDGLDG